MISVEEIKTKVEEALSSGKQRNFVESVDLAINLRNLDMNLPKNRINEDIMLPNSVGKDIKIGVFGGGDIALKAEELGVLVIYPEKIEEMGKNKNEMKALANDINFFIAEANLMPLIGKNWGGVLGPRGKMPTPLLPNMDIGDRINQKKRQITVRTRDRRTFHALAGKKGMDVTELSQNIETIISRIESLLENGMHNIHSVYVKTSMGPAVRVV